MRLELRSRFLTYVGNDRDLLELLTQRLDPTIYHLDRRRADAWSPHDVTPSWRCDRVVLLDHVETPKSRAALEALAAYDAGVPVIVLLERESPTRLTAAGHARMHGADRLVLKPIVEWRHLHDAIAGAFRRLAHWRTRLEQPCALYNAIPVGLPCESPPSNGIDAPADATGHGAPELALC